MSMSKKILLMMFALPICISAKTQEGVMESADLSYEKYEEYFLAGDMINANRYLVKSAEMGSAKAQLHVINIYRREMAKCKDDFVFQVEKKVLDTILSGFLSSSDNDKIAAAYHLKSSMAKCKEKDYYLFEIYLGEAGLLGSSFASSELYQYQKDQNTDFAVLYFWGFVSKNQDSVNEDSSYSSRLSKDLDRFSAHLDKDEIHFLENLVKRAKSDQVPVGGKTIFIKEEIEAKFGVKERK